MFKSGAKYYHSYLKNLIDFLIPKDKKFFKLGLAVPRDLNKTYDYFVVSDLLGYVYDIQNYLSEVKKLMMNDGCLLITQYSAFWEPILRLASFLGLRQTLRIEQNWLSLNDLENFANLAGLQVVKKGTKMPLPIYIPIISNFFNKFVANIFPFSRMGIFHYMVLRKIQNFDPARLPSFSIVVPARNEAGTIEKIIQDLPELGHFTEIIFIEGNSTDNTYEEIERVALKYRDQKKIKYAKQAGKGKGDAVRLGFEMAEGEILSIYDADMTVPAEEVSKFYWAMLENKGDFINGSRLVYPLQKDSMRVLNLIANKLFSLAFSYLLGQRLKDTLCGTKVLWKKDYESIKNNRAFFGDFDPFGDFDLLFGASKMNLKIIDLPIHYKERAYGVTNISRFRHGWLLLKMVVFAARKIKFI